MPRSAAWLTKSSTIRWNSDGELLALGWRPVAEGLPDRAPPGVEDPLDRPAAGGGEADAVGATVVRVGYPVHVARRLQPVYLPGDVRRLDAQLRREVARAQGTGLGQQAQHRYRGAIDRYPGLGGDLVVLAGAVEQVGDPGQRPFHLDHVVGDRGAGTRLCPHVIHPT